MSRTFRFVPFWARQMQPWQKSWKRLSELGHSNYFPWHDDRDKISNGYDNGKGQSHYYTAYPPRGWRDEYVNKETRKFFKRNYHKTKRLYDRRQLNNEQWE